MKKPKSSSYRLAAGPGRGMRIIVAGRTVAHTDPFVYIAGESELWHDGTPLQRTRAALRIIQAAVHVLHNRGKRK